MKELPNIVGDATCGKSERICDETLLSLKARESQGTAGARSACQLDLKSQKLLHENSSSCLPSIIYNGWAITSFFSHLSSSVTDLQVT